MTVHIDAVDRSRIEATTWSFVIPDPMVVVEVLEGQHLQRNFCTDVIDAASEPRRRSGVVAGEGTVTLGAGPETLDSMPCGTVSGVLELADLEGEDGTVFAPIRITSNSIGCYAG